MKKNFFLKYKLLAIIKNSLKCYLTKILYIVFRLFPIKENRIIFESYHGSKYSDSIKTMYEYISKNNGDMDFIWVLNKENEELKKNCKIVKKNTIKYYYYYSTSKYWITNSHRYNDIPPRKGTIYTMIWHGMGDFKKFAADIKGQPNSRFKSLKKDANDLTYLVCSSKNIIDTYSKALLVDKHKIHALGLPRNDIFYNGKLRNLIIEKYKHIFNTDKKIILYAPTYRRDENEFEVIMDFNKMYESLKDDYIILVKTHYTIKHNNLIINNKNFIFDVSYFDDIQELLIISDILITDYSSVFFDFSLMHKPTIFYAYDKNEYINTWGGFYHDYDTFVPGPIVENCDELIEILNDKNKLEIASNNCYKFISQYDDFKDGKSTQRVYNLVFNKNI